MNPINPFFAIIVYFISFSTAYLLKLKFKLNTNTNRYETIDGLRGFLAIGVFIHHSTVWFQYLKTNQWGAPNSNLYNQLGQTSVSLFFMITAFLFISKILNTKSEAISWKKIFLSRFYRLVPMYITSIALIIAIVFIINDWKLKVSYTEFTKELFCWGTFTIFGNPDINGYTFTNLINSWVVWSLTFEWFFYFSLPLISFLIYRKNTSIVYTIISFIFIVLFYKVHGLSKQHILSFLGGAITPFLIKYYSKKFNFNSTIFSILLITCLGLVLLFDTSNNIICKILIIIIFNLIALGNNVFGILKSNTLKFLGEISYSTYLIHGIIIFIAMYFYFNLEVAKNLTPSQFCIAIFIITPILVIISFLTYVSIEKPFINYSKRIKT